MHEAVVKMILSSSCVSWLTKTLKCFFINTMMNRKKKTCTRHEPYEGLNHFSFPRTAIKIIIPFYQRTRECNWLIMKHAWRISGRVSLFLKFLFSTSFTLIHFLNESNEIIIFNSLITTLCLLFQESRSKGLLHLWSRPSLVHSLSAFSTTDTETSNVRSVSVFNESRMLLSKSWVSWILNAFVRLAFLKFPVFFVASLARNLSRQNTLNPD